MPRRKRLVSELPAEEAAALRKDYAALFDLYPNEIRWAGYYEYLLGQGYQLRPRFRPGWVPSWKDKNLDPHECEDSWSRLSRLTLDAVRISDGQQVMIKKLLPSTDDSGDDGEKEFKIVKYLSSSSMREDSRNHSMAYLDHFPIPDVPGGSFLISPLYVPWDTVPLQTVGEAVDLMQQLLEGLAFLHHHHIAHRDCTPPNIMMDWRPMVDEPFHPIHNDLSFDGEYHIEIRPRSQVPVLYYFIDFGLSTWFETKADEPLVTGRYGREQSVPELNSSKPYDPFKVDVFILGAFIQRDLISRYPGLGFLGPLVSGMTKYKPAARPAASQAVQTFGRLVANLPPGALALPLAYRPPGFIESIILAIREFFSRCALMIQRALRLA